MSERRRRLLTTAALLIGFALAGCSTSTAGLDAQLSGDWQTRVVAIADHAAAGDHAAALDELAVLEREAAEARESGSISAERAAIIQQSIALVRSDLESASADETVPEPQQTEESVIENTGTSTDPAPEPGPNDGPGGDTDTGGTPGNPGSGGDKGKNDDKNKGKGNEGNNGKGNGGKRSNSGKGRTGLAADHTRATIRVRRSASSPGSPRSQSARLAEGSARS